MCACLHWERYAGTIGGQAQVYDVREQRSIRRIDALPDFEKASQLPFGELHARVTGKEWPYP